MDTTDTHSQTCEFLHAGGAAEAPAVTHILYGGDGTTAAVCALHARRHGGEYLCVRELATDVDTFTEGVSTDELRPGDVVRFYGARLVIDQDIRTFPGQNNLTVYATEARIDNWNDLAEAAADNPASSAACIFGCPPARHWTIQGNELATWARERTRRR